MKKQTFNPYLPLNEYVPDGEPYVFGDRVYVYGSHDEAGSKIYCAGHYVGWSAPINDLSDWQYHGVIYERTQDPSNPKDELQLWAPDVVQAPDGRYYLYYCFPFRPEIGVAVSDSPAGPFRFYGHIHYPDGTILSEKLPFDPAVLADDDGRVYLYYGFAGVPNPRFPSIELSPGCLVAELEQDMMTVKTTPKLCAPVNSMQPAQILKVMHSSRRHPSERLAASTTWFTPVSTATNCATPPAGIRTGTSGSAAPSSPTAM